MKNVVASIARRCAEHRWLTIGAWSVLVALLFGGAWLIGPALQDELEVSGSDSQAAARLLEELAGDAETEPTSRIVIAAEDLAAHSEVVDEVIVELSEATGQSLANPLDAPTESTRLGLLSPDGGALVLLVDGDPKAEGEAWRSAVDEALMVARDAGLDVAVGAPLGTQLDRTGTINSEAVGVVVALIVLFLALGSALAALIPVATGIIAVAGGVGTIWLLSNATSIPESAVTLAIMVGLGVGIDYTLFMLSRFRAALLDGQGIVPAVALTAHSAGAAAAVAGVTVALCATGLVISGVEFVAWLGYATAIVVLIAVAATLTLCPALLAVIGRRALPRSDRAAVSGSTRPQLWNRIAPRLTRTPALWGIGAIVVLLAVSAPAIGLQLGQSSAGNALPATNQRQVFDLSAQHWGEGQNATLTLVGEGGSMPDWDRLAMAVAGMADVEAVAPPVDRDGVVTMQVIPTHGPSSEEIAALVHELRNERIPQSGIDAHVGGAVATRIDLSDRIAQRLPWLIGVVILASMLLVAGTFRSVLLPVKAALCNVLSITAAFGVITWVFQEGNGVEFFGLDGPIPLDPYVPMMLFAVLFGLSMDYEVFLLSAVRNAWQRGASPKDAVTQGLAETGGVISAAAIIMVAVFLSFTFHPNPVIKIFGVGLAVAVFVDATVIRLLLVPSIMTLMGRAAWWWPFGRSHHRQQALD